MKNKKWFIHLLLILLLLSLPIGRQVAYGAVSSEVGIVFDGIEADKSKPKLPDKVPPKKVLPQTNETSHSSLNLIGLLLILGVTLYKIKLRIKKQIN